MDSKKLAVIVTLAWAAWWTSVAVRFGIVGGREPEEILLAVGVLFILWAQPLLALRGTTAAGVALLVNAAVLALFLGVVGGPTAIAYLFVQLLLPLVIAGILLLSRKP